MGRIKEAQRIPTADGILGHYAEAEVVHGGPIWIALGVGRPQLHAKRNQYHDLQDQLLARGYFQRSVLESDVETG